MMTAYIVKLLILIPMLGLLIAAMLWVWKRVEQQGLGVGRSARRLMLVDALSLGPGTRIAVVRFDDRDILVAFAKGGATLLASHDAPPLADGEVAAPPPPVDFAALWASARSLGRKDRP